MPYFAVSAVYSGEQNGLNQMYYFRILNSEIITRAAPEDSLLRGCFSSHGIASLFITLCQLQSDI